MKIELTADYLPWAHSDNPGEIAIRVNGYTVKTLYPERPPGAEPEAEENLILETLWKWLEGHLQDHDAASSRRARYELGVEHDD